MADDITQQLLQMQSLINASQGNGKPAFLFGWIPLDANVGGPFAMQSLSPMTKNIPTLFNGSGGKQGGLASKFLEAIQSIPEDLKKRSAEAGVMYAGDLPSGSILNGGGGGFTSAPRMGGDMEIG